MPKYRALDTAVHLAVSDLAATTTINPVKRKGAAAKAQTDRVEAAITHRQYLRERLAEVPGSDGIIHFLGAEKMPFLAVETRFEEYEPPTASKEAQDAIVAERGLLLAIGSNASEALDDEHSPLTSLGSTPTKDEESLLEARRSSSGETCDCCLHSHARLTFAKYCRLYEKLSSTERRLPPQNRLTRQYHKRFSCALSLAPKPSTRPPPGDVQHTTT